MQIKEEALKLIISVAFRKGQQCELNLGDTEKELKKTTEFIVGSVAAMQIKKPLQSEAKPTSK